MGDEQCNNRKRKSERKGNGGHGVWAAGRCFPGSGANKMARIGYWSAGSCKQKEIFFFFLD